MAFPRIGYFRQILPVLTAANCSQIVAACFKISRLFGLFNCLHLQHKIPLQALKNYPNATTKELQFPLYLLYLGEGKLQFNEKDLVSSQYP